MIKEEYVLTRSDGVEIHRHYSDDHRYIIQQETGIQFVEAEDPIPCKYTYIEGDYFEDYYSDLIDDSFSDEKIEAAISNATYVSPNDSVTMSSTEITTAYAKKHRKNIQRKPKHKIKEGNYGTSRQIF